MAVEMMSVKEYVNYRKAQGNIISTVAVAKAIRLNHRTPGIKCYDMLGGSYILYVDLAELDEFLVTIKKPVNLRA